jgi:UDP-N-acetylglucosamine--N-acetylmuramyl-(pentapeptide) pyrophosphoryl-undecaprenol N-acetylglucosamine transferase
MSYAIAAAGTGGHVFPGLAVGEALVASGVSRQDVLFVGGHRLEATIYPAAGFPFLSIELAGLQRRFTLMNFRIPSVVLAASRRIAAEYRERRVRAVLAMGGYVSVPAGLAARRSGTVLMLHEQNAEAGLANRVMARWALRVFGSFPVTGHLPRAEWVGNPIRTGLARFDREQLREVAMRMYQLDPGARVVGIFGGSLGAGVLNDVAAAIAAHPGAAGLALLHLTGIEHFESVSTRAAGSSRVWRPIGFEQRMELFYAACDLVIARAGGAVAELTATATPSILVPGGFGSAGHQAANASALAGVGAALVVPPDQVDLIPALVIELFEKPERLRQMAAGCVRLARPDAAAVIAAALGTAHG